VVPNGEILRTGSKSSAWPSIRTALLRTGSIFPFSPTLTDQHLKDLGVALGDRLKMLRAIRDLGDASVAVTAYGSLLAALLAISYNVGYFLAIGNSFTLFSISEHIVFALQALPLAF